MYARAGYSRPESTCIQKQKQKKTEKKSNDDDDDH